MVMVATKTVQTTARDTDYDEKVRRKKAAAAPPLAPAAAAAFRRKRWS